MTWLSSGGNSVAPALVCFKNKSLHSSACSNQMMGKSITYKYRLPLLLTGSRCGRVKLC